MIIVDRALQKRQDEGNPVRVGIIGAGYMGRGTALQILTAVPGMQLAAIYNRTLAQAARAYQQAGVDEVQTVSDLRHLEANIRSNQPSITDDPAILCQADGVDVIIEATGEIEFGAEVVLKAIEYGKHVVLMNAELDATVGPILKVLADQAGVVVSNADGDQPGVTMNLFRFVQSIGCRPVLAGNIKGFQDHYRTPETQRDFAERHCQKPRMITSFADGTKISMEMAVVANATGFPVGIRGMYGPRCKHVTEAVDLFPKEKMLNGGLVDFVLGAEPGPGVFVIGYNDEPIKRQYMSYFKMGDGPFYVFYVPYHLPHLEAPLTAARAALFSDAAVTPLGAPVCEVIATAKRDLQAGETLDGIGGFSLYGQCENIAVAQIGCLLPMGLAENGRLKRSISKDQALTYNDVELPKGRLCDELRARQDAYFATSSTTLSHSAACIGSSRS